MNYKYEKVVLVQINRVHWQNVSVQIKTVNKYKYITLYLTWRQITFQENVTGY